jgi:hypothetical protein
MGVAPSTIGAYTVTRELGRGGMGVGYLASDTRLGRAVAIKALPEHLAADPDRLARFEREARTLASVSHPNIAGIYGVEVQDGQRYVHSLLPDGLFVPEAEGTLTFVPLPEPTPADIETLTFRIARRLTAVVERLCADECETEAVLERTAAALRQALATAVEPPLPKAGLDLLGLDSPAAHRNFEAHSGLVTVVAPRDRARPFCPSLDCSWRSMRGARPRLEAEVVGEAARGVARPSLRGPEPGALRVESWRKGAPGDGGETAGERAHGLRVAAGPALRS